MLVDLVDTAMRRPGRLDREIELSVPTPADRQDILLTILSEVAGNSLLKVNAVPNTTNEPEYLSLSAIKAVAANAHGMVGSDLLLVVKEAHYIALSRMLDRSKDSLATLGQGIQNMTLADDSNSVAGEKFETKITNSDLQLAVRKINPSALREVAIEVPTIKWTDIGGMDAVKSSLVEVLLSVIISFYK